jgi:hypothetical protein
MVVLALGLITLAVAAVSFAMNLFKAVILPVNFWTSFWFVEAASGG